MAERQDEGEPTVAPFDMADRQGARAQPSGHAQPEPAESDEITVAVETQSLCIRTDRKSDAAAAAQIFLRTGRSGEAFAGADDLRKTRLPSVYPGPELSAGGAVFTDRNHGRNADIVVER